MTISQPTSPPAPPVSDPAATRLGPAPDGPAVLRADLRIDADRGEQVAVTVFAPADADDGTPRVVAFGYPGGGLARGYFDVHHGTDDSYSQAAYHVARGWVFVACDHLGVGESSLPAPETLTYDRLGAGNDAAARRVVDGLRAGSLLDGLGPVTVRGTIGMGHSMGGCISIVTQGNHATFDALAVLGFSAIQTVIPTPQGGTLDVELHDRDDADSSLEQGVEGAGGVEMFRWAFYLEDTPAELVEADMGPGGYPRTDTPPPWGSATTPSVIFSMMSPGVVAAEAAAITSPILVAAGERDVIPTLRAEPAVYTGSSDITIVEVPGLAHMHSFGRTRAELWRRLHGWAESVLA